MTTNKYAYKGWTPKTAEARKAMEDMLAVEAKDRAMRQRGLSDEARLRLAEDILTDLKAKHMSDDNRFERARDSVLAAQEAAAPSALSGSLTTAEHNEPNNDE
ncbi:hypothetical protein ACO2I3_04060 [Leptospira interrogans]